MSKPSKGEIVSVRAPTKGTSGRPRGHAVSCRAGKHRPMKSALHEDPAAKRRYRGTYGPPVQAFAVAEGSSMSRPPEGTCLPIIRKHGESRRWEPMGLQCQTIAHSARPAAQRHGRGGPAEKQGKLARRQGEEARSGRSGLLGYSGPLPWLFGDHAGHECQPVTPGRRDWQAMWF